MTSRAPCSLAIATVTLARDPDEERLLRDSMTTLAEVGVPVIVADGGSGAAFVEFLRSLPRVTVTAPAEKGLVGQVRGSLARCSQLDAELILYTEADKRQFFAKDVRWFIERAAAVEGAGIAVAGRSEASFETFPPLQRYTEGSINRLCGEFLGGNGDYSYGPFLLHRDLAPHVDRVDAELGWGWRHFLFSVCHRLGRRIVHVNGDFSCPEEQRVETRAERLHRLRQLGQNVNGLLAGMTTPLQALGPGGL
jgi:hypothetical protein